MRQVVVPICGEKETLSVFLFITFQFQNELADSKYSIMHEGGNNYKRNSIDRDVNEQTDSPTLRLLILPKSSMHVAVCNSPSSCNGTITLPFLFFLDIYEPHSFKSKYIWCMYIHIYGQKLVRILFPAISQWRDSQRPSFIFLAYKKVHKTSESDYLIPYVQASMSFF